MHIDSVKCMFSVNKCGQGRSQDFEKGEANATEGGAEGTYSQGGLGACSPRKFLVFSCQMMHSSAHLPLKYLIQRRLYLKKYEFFSCQLQHQRGFPSLRLPQFLWFLCYFHGISVELYGIQAEFHGMPWMLCYFHGISVEFYSIQVECHGIPWNAMDVILFPWHFSGILWHPDGMPWNAMDVMLFPWHFSEIPWHFSGMPWNSMGYRRLVL